MPSHFAAAILGTNRKDTRQVIRVSDEITCQSRSRTGLKVPWPWLVSIDLLSVAKLRTIRCFYWAGDDGLVRLDQPGRMAETSVAASPATPYGWGCFYRVCYLQKGLFGLLARAMLFR
jgi:hypothetical protein